MRMLQLGDLETSYTHARRIAIPEKSLFRLMCPLIVMWPSLDSHMTITPFEQSRPAADVTREVAGRWLLAG